MPTDTDHALTAPEARRVGGVLISPADDTQTRREKLARIVLDEMYQFVGLLDADGLTLEINRAALDGAGVRLDDIRGKPFWEARWFQVSRDSVQAQKDFVRRARAGEFIRCDLEVYGEAAGDHTIVVDFSLLPVRDERGEVVFLLAEGRNITAKKQAEAEVARKTAELQQALERITQLDQLKSDLFANVSHELRTPLTLILGPAEELLAAGVPLPDRQRHQLQVIHRSAIALLKHVDDLLELARLDSGQSLMRVTALDLAALVRASAEQFHAIAPARAITYQVQVPAALPAEVDAEKFERILLNLLSNAFKFTPDGGRILCRLEALDDGARALLTVQDSGPGVPAGFEQVIFERFRQLQQGTTRGHGGTGLGLAIVKDFVERHGGSVSVHAAPGGGASFQVMCPLHAAPGEAVLRQAAAPSPMEVARAGRSAAGVLAELAARAPLAPDSAAEADAANAADERLPAVMIVEDNAEVCRFIAEALRGDYRLATEGDGQRALARLHDRPPDLVITDLMLPGLGGDRLVEAMRREPALADVPVLVLSALGDSALRSRLLSESVQDYLTKPFSAPELRARVRNLVAVRQARQALQRELASQNQDLGHLARSLVSNQQALRESEHRWWAIYEHSPVGIALADADGMIRAANPAFRTMVRYGPDEIRGVSIERLTLVEDRAAMRERLRRLLGGEVRDCRLQRRFHQQDGSVVWANTSVSVIPASGTQAPMLLVLAEDITEQKLAERSLARARHELARVTRASSLGELAASIAHEVNQPLAAVVTNGHAGLRWLDASPPDEAEARLALQRIIRDASRAGEVITRIRNFLRRTEPVRQAVQLPAVIQEVLALVRAESQNQQVSVRSALDDATLPPVWGDAVQLQQVILNLVMNALESIARTGAGQGSVTISGRLDPPDTLRIDVRDSGAGIEPAAMARIFEAFYTSKSEGMGMGLAISQSIVDAHGGRLWASANLDGGATFHLTLPVVVDEALP